jgi:uncharacterized protein YhfF
MGELHRWGFDEPGPLRDKLTALALAGTKTTTASLALEFELDDDPLPIAGQVDLLVDSDDVPVAIVETVSVRVVRLADVDDQHAIDEGEGYADAAAFRVSHEAYWLESGSVDKIRAYLGDPSWTLDDDTLVVAERFRIVERLGGSDGSGD